MTDGAVRTRRWTRVEYDRLIEAEILGPEDRIELLGGELVVKEPQHRPHATAILLVVRGLERLWLRLDGPATARRCARRRVRARARCVRRAGRAAGLRGPSVARGARR